MSAVGLIITIASVAVAAGMGVLVAIVLRDERRRSHARVLALEALAARPDGPGDSVAAFLSETDDEVPPAPHLLGDLPADGDVSQAGGLFAEPEYESPWPRRFAIAGGLLAVLMVVVLVLRATGSHSTRPEQARAATPAAQLELVSMRHSLDHDMLTITGLVRNPNASAAVSHLTATAFLFDPAGSFVASGRAPLQLATLAAGDESPFVIAIPVTMQVARYRVSFRDESGRVVAHVDRRGAAPVARNE